MRLMRLIGVMLLSSILLFPGCARSTILYPIQEVDIHFMKAGDTYESKKDGAFLSNAYLKEVERVKIKPTL